MNVTLPPNSRRFVGLRVKLLVGFTLLFSAVFGNLLLDLPVHG